MRTYNKPVPPPYLTRPTGIYIAALWHSRTANLAMMDDNEIARRLIATGWAKVDDVDITNRIIATGWTNYTKPAPQKQSNENEMNS